MKEFSVQNGSPYGHVLIERQYSGIQNICKILNIKTMQKSNKKVRKKIKPYLNILCLKK